MTTLARAVLQTAQNGPLQVRELRIPDPSGHQVLVRIFASGICNSQIFWMHHRRQHEMLFGHEGYGVVAKIGSSVTGLREGDHVIVTWLPSAAANGRIPDVPIFDMGGERTARAPISLWTASD